MGIACVVTSMWFQNEEPFYYFGYVWFICEPYLEHSSGKFRDIAVWFEVCVRRVYCQCVHCDCLQGA